MLKKYMKKLRTLLMLWGTCYCQYWLYWLAVRVPNSFPSNVTSARCIFSKSSSDIQRLRSNNGQTFTWDKMNCVSSSCNLHGRLDMKCQMTNCSAVWVGSTRQQGLDVRDVTLLICMKGTWRRESDFAWHTWVHCDRFDRFLFLFLICKKMSNF